MPTPYKDPRKYPAYYLRKVFQAYKEGFVYLYFPDKKTAEAKRRYFYAVKQSVLQNPGILLRMEKILPVMEFSIKPYPGGLHTRPKGYYLIIKPKKNAPRDL